MTRAYTMRLDAYDARRNQGRGRRRVTWMVLFIAVFVGGVMLFRTGGTPQLQLLIDLPAIGPKTPFKVVASAARRGLVELRVRARQDDKYVVIHEATFEPRPAWAFWGPMVGEEALALTIDRSKIPNVRGKELTLEVEAKSAGTILLEAPIASVEKTLPLRLSPPRISVQSANIFAAQGGAEAVVYSVGPTAVRHGVEAGDWFFEGHPVPGGSEGDYFALFAVPYDMDNGDERLHLYAEDDVGNVARTQFLDRFTKRPFKTDTITVSDRFMQLVVPRILAKTPELEDKGELLANYIAINSELRKKNADFLVELSKQTTNEFLWHQPFVQMPAKVVSSFADRRTYLYDGKKVDQQDHLGFDLASVRRAEIPAANSGRVVYADYLGIYGNTVVIDHGYGLQSLYSHMSKFVVRPGDAVERGQTIGRTGATGLALGDHLHFTLMINGLPVTPIEWWDSHWIHDRLALKLGDALGFQGKSGSN